MAKGFAAKEVIFTAGPLQQWEASGLPIWQGASWEEFEQQLFGPLIKACRSLYIFPSQVGPNADHPTCIDLQRFIEANSVLAEEGYLVFNNPLNLIGHQLAPYFWAPVRFSRAMSKLMLFDAKELPKVLHALSFVTGTSNGPLHRAGEWQLRDRLAKVEAKAGNFAIVQDGREFKLFYGSNHCEVVERAIAFVNERWAAHPIRHGEAWHPGALFSA